MKTEIKLKKSALTEAEKIHFIEKVYNAKVTKTKMVKIGNYYFIEAVKDSQEKASLDYYYHNALELELNDY